MQQTEENLYATAGEEIVTKNVSRGLWTKAFAMALGDEAKTKALYIELRVDQLKEQIVIAHKTEEIRRPREDAAIRAQLDLLLSVPWENAEQISSSQFDGSISVLSTPISVSRASALSEQLEFEIVDLIKRGFLKGVRSNNEWYFDLNEES